jgi:UPF0755 protein
MQPLEQWLERFFALSDRVQQHLSMRWREHANRRTIIISLVLGALALALYVYIIQPPDNFPTDELVSVPEGATTSEIGDILRADGVIRNAAAFRLLVEVMGSQRGVHAGDYLFKQPVDIFTIAHALVAGQFGLEPDRFRIPEGASVNIIADVFSSRLQRFDPSDFLAKAQPLEGYLFPDTYFFLPNATQDTVITTMRENFDAHLSATTTTGKTLSQDVVASGHSLNDIVIMASIIEREAPGEQDRKMIAGVLWNRIKRGMPLQTDVPLTALTGKADSQLTMADLATTSPYNTYTHAGLPPGAIGNPSFESLEAAADPIASTYLYYLADKNGVTHYAKTYAQHLQNIRKYLGT